MEDTAVTSVALQCLRHRATCARRKPRKACEKDVGKKDEIHYAIQIVSMYVLRIEEHL